jgi:RNA polymerase sigma-70 factor (ECF subfamily)
MRQVYVLRDIDEVSGEETADRLGITLAAMKSRLHRARALVRESMDVCIECQTQDYAGP